MWMFHVRIISPFSSKKLGKRGTDFGQEFLRSECEDVAEKGAVVAEPGEVG
jgi:hypothetical protein